MQTLNWWRIDNVDDPDRAMWWVGEWGPRLWEMLENARQLGWKPQITWHSTEEAANRFGRRQASSSESFTYERKNVPGDSGRAWYHPATRLAAGERDRSEPAAGGSQPPPPESDGDNGV